MTMMLVCRTTTTEESGRFLLVATTTSWIGALIQHVFSEALERLISPDFFKRLRFAIAYRVGHLGMATGIGFSGRIGMQMYPRIDAEGLALSEEPIFSLGQRDITHKIGAVILVLTHTILSSVETCWQNLCHGADRIGCRIYGNRLADLQS